MLDVYNFSTADGGAIVQWTDLNGTNQQFRLADSDGGYVRLINRNSNKALEVQGASTADGGNIVQYADWGGTNQQWQLVRVGGSNPPPSGGSGCGKAPTLASGTHTIQSSGKSRSFILRVPANYNNSHPYRLIFAFHWRGGTCQRRRLRRDQRHPWSYYGQQEQSNNSAIFVAPQGIGNGWANSGGEDVTFVDDMIRRIESSLCVDTTQRFALGFSYGGGMSYAARLLPGQRLPRRRGLLRRAAQRVQRRHPAHRVHRAARHLGQRPQHLRGTVAARHVRPEQRLHRPEPARAGGRAA